MRAAAIALMGALAGVGVAPGACWVEGHCRTDDDCAHPAICDERGRCTIECRTDDDCALEEACDEQRCRPAPGCAGCTFAKAFSDCVHGDCSMGGCYSGWHDLNDDPGDGCELFCVPSGAERCNHRDDDCDGAVDELFDLSQDPSHCGDCDHACSTPPHAEATCESGACAYACHDGWFDNDGRADNGCESPTCVPTDEICDGRDNDCDQDIDEGFDKTLPESCGFFCAVCEYDHAEALCVEGACAMGPCEPDWHDVDERADTGCEYPCAVTGPEVCDGADNDCDGVPDEGLICCPDDMTLVDGRFCIDRYEASLESPGDGGDGSDGGVRAVSLPDVLPYWDRQLTAAEASTWCQAAGKRLCNASEWVLSCRGPDDTDYCYGDDYEPTTCNGIGAFGGGDFHLAPTGSFGDCTHGWGLYDINGNVWEMTADGLVRGGAFNCLDSATLHQCDFSIEPSRVVAIGFRCCL